MTEDIKLKIECAIFFLRNTLIETETSIAISNDKIIFFRTKDYLLNEDFKKIDTISFKINDLVK